MKILFPIYCFFVMLFFSLLLLVFVWPAEAADFDAENSRLYIPELRSGEWCYEDVGIQFFPGKDGMWDGAFQLIQSRVVDCPTDEEIESCGNAFGPCEVPEDKEEPEEFWGDDRLKWKPDCNGFAPSEGCG